jgi:hypothetical protein
MGKIMKLARLALVAFLALSSTACVSMKSYPDPQFHKASYETLGKFNAVTPVRLEVVFQRNGADMPKLVNQVRPLVEQALQKSGAFSLSSEASVPLLRVTINNVADLHEAFKKGFVTGLTFGGKGSTVDDFYEAKIEFHSGGTLLQKNYKHVMHTTVGNAAVPVEGVKPVSVSEAFAVVVQDVMLNFIKDMKDDGKISERSVQLDRLIAAR